MLTRALPYILCLVAAGIVLFWAHWFWSGNHLHAEPEFYRRFENAFPIPDLFLAACMLWLAWLIRTAHPKAPLLGGWVAGMLAYLFLLDFHYHIFFGEFGGTHPQGAFLPAIMICLATSLLAFMLLAWSIERFQWARVTPQRIVATVLLVIAVVEFMFWNWSLDQMTWQGKPIFLLALAVPSLLMSFLALCACNGVAVGQGWAWPLAFCTLGGLTFGAAVHLCYLLSIYVNPLAGFYTLVGGSIGVYALTATRLALAELGEAMPSQQNETAN